LEELRSVPNGLGDQDELFISTVPNEIIPPEINREPLTSEVFAKLVAVELAVLFRDLVLEGGSKVVDRLSILVNRQAIKAKHFYLV
jgi:hypothetical protein